MKIYTLVLGEYQTNCYLVSDENGDTAVIDPGYLPQEILRVAREQKLAIRAVLLTHGHFDHVGGVKGITEATHCPVYGSERDLTLPEPLRHGLTLTDFYAEGDEIDVGTLRFTVMQTPGHSVGSVCLRCGDALFSGDTLFAGACGRTDFPGSSGTDMRHSLARLKAIDAPLNVYPGHGPATTLQHEKQTNPYLQYAT